MLGRKSGLTDTKQTKQTGYFFMERPHSYVSSVKMTDSLASYKSYCNFNGKF